MKKLIITALLVVSASAFAQNGNKRPQMNPEKRVERMTTQLNLDAKQQEQLKEIYTEEAKNRETQKDVSREEMMAQRKKSNEKIKAILTPEQSKKWEAEQEKMRQRMQERMNNRPQEGANMEN
ncbi:MAG: autotransporter outer membrane beta-barrel domain-containing protein [Flavobacterium sp.]